MSEIQLSFNTETKQNVVVCDSDIVKKQIVFLDRFWVSEEYRKSGLGSYFFKFMVEICKKQNMDFIVWYVSPFDKQVKGKHDVDSLIKWYRKNGAEILFKQGVTTYMIYYIKSEKNLIKSKL